MENRMYTHILQKKGILKTFSVAKVVKKKDIEELKSIIKGIAKDENEYNQLLKEELARMSDMHNKDNPIPGIIYSENIPDAKNKLLYTIAQKLSEVVDKHQLDKREMAFLVSIIISKLDLDQEDFIKLNEELKDESEDEDFFEDDDYEDED